MRERSKGEIYSANINDSLDKIINKNESLQSFFNDIQKLFENNKEVFYVFCCYLKYVMNEEILSEQIMTLLKNIKESESVQIKDSEYFKMNNIEENGLITISCNELEVGKIKWCNDKVTSILGFYKHELLKLKINKIIPPAIANRHTQYIRKWVESYKNSFINKTRITFFINKDNYLCPVILYVKLLPTIENGIEVCGLMQKVIDNTFILFKDPTEIKVNCKIGFCLTNEDGVIEAVDCNANIFLGLPNLVREGTHLKITIDKKKINLFNLIPQLPLMISKNIFSGEVKLDNESLKEDYNNDENGLFLNIDKRIRYLVQKNIVMGFATNFNYYNDEKLDNMEEFKNSEQFRALQYEVIPSIFKKHTVRADVYDFTSSHGDMKLYLFKLYFVPKIGVVKQIPLLNASGTPKKANFFNRFKKDRGSFTSKFESNKSLSPKKKIGGSADIPGKSQSKSLIKAIDNMTKVNFISNIIKEQSKKDLMKEMLRSDNDLARQENKNNDNIVGSINHSSIFNIPGEKKSLLDDQVNQNNTINRNNTNNLSNLNKITSNIPFQNQSIDKIKAYKDSLFDDRLRSQSRTYKCIQFQLYLLIICLITLVSVVFINNYLMVINLTPLYKTMSNYSIRQGLTSNLILNIILQISAYNKIEFPDKITSFNFTSDKIKMLLEEDLMSMRTTQNSLEDEDVRVYQNYKTEINYTYFDYQSYNLDRRITIKKYIMNTAIENFIGSFNKYFFINNYSLTPKERLFTILNPRLYSETDLIPISELESRFLEILNNGLNLINRTNISLGEIGVNFKEYLTSFKIIILYLNSGAILFTISLCIGLIVSFMNLFKKQDDNLRIFSHVDFIYGVKINIVCDKLLDILNNTEIEIAKGENKFINFYSKD